MRLIDADELKKAIPEDIEPDYFENCARCAMLSTQDVEKIVDSQPTVEADPVRHAHWVKGESIISTGFGDVARDIPHCSECLSFSEHESSFCPECGAKMDEAEEQC